MLLLTTAIGQAQSVSVAEWNFGTTSYTNVANVKHAAISTASMTLAASSGTTLTVSGTGTTSDRQMQAGSWNGTETTTLVSGRSSLTPVSGSKVLYSSFAVSHTAGADWNAMKVQLDYRRPLTTDVTKVRAYLTWAEGGVWKTRYSAIATLTGTTLTNLSLPLNAGASVPSVIQGNSFLLELHFWGSTSSTNTVVLDNVKFQVNSMSTTTASSVLWVSTYSGTGGRLEKYDMTTTAKTVVGLTSDSSNHVFFDIAWAPSGKLYGVEPFGANSRVYEINPATGATTWVGTITGGHNGMVFNASGLAYVSSFDGNIYSFSPASLSTGSTTTSTLAYDSPATTPNGGTLSSGGDLAWVGNDLYYAATGGGKFYLYKVASGSSTVSLVGEILNFSGTPVSDVFGLIGDGYGSIWAQAGPYLYKLSSTTARAEAVGLAVTSNTVYGGAISTEFSQINRDYGDYSGLGAVSAVVNTRLRLGAQVDGESDISNSTATSDDASGVDDEDGVTVPAILQRGSTASLTVNVTNTSGAPGYLNAWIDFNRNGVLTDSGEQIVTDAAVANGVSASSLTYSYSVPSGATNGTAGVRVRFSSASSPGPIGESLASGETEDNTTTISCPTISLTPTTLTDPGIGSAYTQGAGFNASGGVSPYSYSASGVPPGMTFDTASKKLSGTPTTPGSYTLVVTAVDSVGCSGSVSVPLVVGCPTITLGPVSPPVATVGSAWSFTLSVSGASGSPVVYAATTALPAWLSLNPTSGLVSGTPPNSSPFSFSIRSTDPNGCVGSIGYTIYPTCPSVTVSGTLPTLVPRNVSYGTQTLTASGGVGPYTWDVASGSLPAGLVLNNAVTTTTATITGTPNTLQTSTFIIRATDSRGCTGTKSFTVTIGCPTVAVSLPSVAATVGTPYSQTATASGGTSPYVFALNTGSLPTWATLNSSSGLLSGTPNTTTSATFTLKATDANGCVGVSTSYTIVPGSSSDFGDWNGSGAATTTASSTVNGNLRLGATVDSEASVTPNADANADGADEDGVTMPVMIGRSEAVTMPVTVFNNNTAGRYLKGWVDFNNDGTFTDTDIASGGERVYNATVPASSLLQTVNVGFTVPATASVGTKRGARFRLTNNSLTTAVSNGATGETEDYVVRICPQIVICPAVTQLPVATRSAAYSVAITALGGAAPYTFSTTGTVPAGLTLNTTSGLLSGTPTTDQTATFTVKATDGTGCEVTRTYTLQVVGPGTVVQVVGGSGTNNVPVRAASFLVNGSTTTQSTEPSGVTAQTNSVIELRSLTIQDGTVNKTLNVANLNGGTVTNVTVPATNGSFGVLLNGTATSIATSGATAFSTAAAQVSSNTNLNHYIFDDRGEGEPDSTGEYDIRFNYGFTSEDYIVVQERFGNSHVQLQPLDATGNVIAGSRTVQVRGTHDWNTGHASATYQNGQSYYLTVVRQTIFGTTTPIFGFRLSINGADCKFFGMSDNPFSDNPTNAGVVGDLVWNDTDQDGVKDAGEAGISGVQVKLLNAADLTTVTTTVTDGSGNYSFTAVAPGDYRIEFVRPTGYVFSPADAGGNDSLDSDADTSTGRTAVFTMLPCDSISYLDGGMYGVDYGDYNGFATATQTVNSIIRIGTLATDAEVVSPANGTATGDDNTGDDEDLTMPSVVLGSTTTLAVPMTVTAASLSGSTARVNVFVDWNGDSDVADTNETLTAQTVSASGTFNFSLTPPAGTSAGTKYLRIRAAEGATHPGFSGNSTLKGEVEDYAVTTSCPTVVVTPTTVAAGTAGVAYAQATAFTASGGTAPYSYSASGLPGGLTFDSAQAKIIGTPTVTGLFNVTVTATDASNCAGSVVVPLTVGCATISLTPTSLTNATVGSAYTQATAFSATGGQGTYTFSASGVPAGMSFDATNKKLIGTPTSAGTSNVTINAIDSNNCLGTVVISFTRVCPTITVTPTTLANATVGSAYTQATAFSASGGSGTYTFSASGVPAGMSFDATNKKLIGTPTSAGTGNVTITATDSNNCAGVAVIAFTRVCPTITVVPTTLANGAVGVAYTQATAFSASGGSGTYTFGASGVPAGMSFDATNKKLIGTPTSTGTSTVTITATDANNCAGSAVVSFTVSCPTLTVTPTTLANATVGSAYTQATAFSATGGSGTYTFSASGVPAGMSFDATNKKLIGTPTSAGTGNVTITATDSNSCVGSVVVSFTRVCPTITVVPTTLADAVVGVPYTQATAFSASGGSGTYTFSASGVPAGMSFDATSKKLVGTPTTVATSNVTITATDANGCAGSVTVSLSGGCPTISVTPTTLANATVGSAYTQATAFSASGGSGTYTFSASGVPAGMSFDATNKKLIGTPTSAGTGNVTITATDSNNCVGTVVISFTRVCPTITVVPTSLSNGAVGVAYTQATAFSASGGSGTYTFSASGVPAGMSFDATNKKLIGTPTSTGTSTVTITATDANGCPGSVVIPFNVGCPTVTVAPTTLVNATVGSAYTQATAFSASGGSGTYTFSASGMPAGMSFDATNKKLIGTPTSAGTGNVTITATDSNNCVGTAVISFTRVCPTITVSPTTLANATVGSAYTQVTAFSASGGSGTYTFSASGVPAGMSFDATNKKLIGTPTSAGTGNVTITATDSNNCAGTAVIAFTRVCPTITVVPATLANGVVGVSYTQATAFSASGGSGTYTFSASGVPAGMSFDATNKKLTGAPSAVGLTSTTVTATDANGCSGSVVVNFSVGCPTITVTPTTLANATVGSAYTQATAFSASGGSGTYTFSASGVPAGMSFDATSKKLIGTPTSAGTSDVTITATDSNTCVGTVVISFTRVCPTLTVSPTTLADGTAGVAYTQATAFSASGASGTFSYSASGVPPGMSFDATNRKLIGTPSTQGAYTVTITATFAGACSVNQNVSLTIQPPANLGIGNLVWEDFNNDGIKQITESGLPNASVRLYRSGADNTVNTLDDTLLAGPVVTSATGAYSFTGLTAGNYFVRVTPPASNFRTGGTPVVLDNNVDGDNNGSQPGGVGTSCYSPIIALTANGETVAEDGDANTNMTVDFGLWGGFTVGNNVWHDADNDGVKDNGEVLLPAVTLQLMTPGADLVAGGTDDTVMLTTTTNALGVYNFFVPQTGKFYVRLNPIPGYELPSGTTFGDTGADNDNNGSQPGNAGSFVNSVVFDLQAATEPGSAGTTNVETTIDFGLWGGLTVRGYVWNDANNNGLTDPAAVPSVAPETGIESQSLALYSTGADQAIGGSGANADSLVGTTMSLADGSYAFSQLLPGRYYIRITPSTGYPLASALVDTADNGELYDNNGAQPGGIGTVITSPVFQLSAVTEPGSAGTTSVENSIWFGLRERPSIVISPPTLPGGQIELPYSQPLSASGGTAPYVWSVTTGTLPTGLTLNTSTGAISGTPTVAGTSFFTVQAQDAQLVTGSRSYSLTIYQIDISPPTLPVAYRGRSFSQVLSASGGTGSYSWSLTSGALPPGVSLSLASGQIAGIPTATGTYAFTVKATDANGFYGTRAYTMTVLGTLGIGNVIFEDLDANKHYDSGEGVDGITVELYRADQTPGIDAPVDSLVTANGGKYVFADVVPGTYVVHVPASEFGATGLLRGLFSLVGTQAGDDDVGEDGLDTEAPQTEGVSSAPVELVADMLPTDATGESGYDHESDNSSQAGDANVDLTVDLGFYRRVGVGNMVFMDGNGNGRADNGEGVAGVTVQLYEATQTPGSSSPVAFTTTNSSGRYLMSNLQPGLYRVHIPKEMFQTGAPLHTKVSIAPGLAGDDDVGEDGLNNTTPSTQGVTSNEVYLLAGLAPTNQNGESGMDNTSDDDIDAAVDLTVDFGFQSPAIIGNLVFVDNNNNGHYDAGEGVDGVDLDIYSAGAQVGSSALASVTTADGGHYLFGSLPGGTYFVHVRASNFGVNGPLAGKVSLLGAAVTNSDDSVGEDGLDEGSPQLYGIKTADFLVQAGSMPLDSASGEATGENGFQADDDNGNGQDANGNMTIDFGFKALDNNKVAVGNLVFSDVDGDNRYDEGEGVDGVLLELHSAATDLLLASTYSANDGLYYFGDLAPGDYYIVVAASNFQGTGKLVGLMPALGQGGDNGLDDDADENGDDPSNPELTGVRSTDFTLASGTEPTDNDTELGAATYLDAAMDDNSDLTIDFAFYTPGGLGNVVFVDANQNGRADAGEGVGNVTVRLFKASADPISGQWEAELLTDSTVGHEGAFLFQNVAPGDYFLHIPGAMFNQGAPLFGKVSLTGVEAEQNDDHQGENGIDSVAIAEQGVSTAVKLLRPGTEPTGTAEAGLYGGDDTALGDDRYDLTLDFGFVANPTVGNLVFRDVDRDGLYTDGVDTGIDGVTVELYTSGANPVLMGTTQTANGGRYFFSVEAGSYVIKVPASMFEVGQPLANLRPSQTAAGDDDAGQDAIDSANRLTAGIQTAPFTLAMATMPTAATGETGYDSTSDDLNDGDINLTVDLGFQPMPLGVGNLVFNDINTNGFFDAGDVGVADVTVKLFVFGDDPLTAVPVATTQTDANGFYLLNAYVEDNYFVHVDKDNFATGGALVGLVSSTGSVSGTGDDQADENGIDATVPANAGISSAFISLIYGAQPVETSTEIGAGAVSDNDLDEDANLTVDFGFHLPAGAPLAGRVRRDLNNDGVATAADAPLPSVEVALYDDANANGTLDTAEMSAVETTISDATGSYVFSDVNAGNYLVVATPLPGAMAESDTDGGVPDQTQVTVADAPVTGIDFLQSLAADTFAQWQRQHVLDGKNAAGDNPDADSSSNLLEYALGTDPASGVVSLPGLELIATPAIDAVVRRPANGHADLRYQLQGSVDGAVWSGLSTAPQTTNDAGIETLRYRSLADESLFAGQALGYVRLHVVLDADQDGTAEAEANTIVSAFTRQTLPVGQTTLSMPLLTSEVFAGEASVTSGRSLAITQGKGLMDALQPGRSYEVQMLAGPHAGERYELDLTASTDTTLTTRTDLPATLGTARIAVRPVQTLAKLLPPVLLGASDSGNTADRALFFEAGAYRVHWLAATPSGARWVTDASLTDMGSRRLAHREGLLVHLRQSPVTLPLVGQVPVAAPGLTVSGSTHLVGSGSLSAVNPAGSGGDRLRAWSGDVTSGTSSFIDYTYGAAGWTSDTTALPSGTPPLLNPFRAVFTVKAP